MLLLSTQDLYYNFQDHQIPFNDIIVYYSIGFTKSTLKLCQQISKSGGGALLIRRKILMLVSENQHCKIFFRLFCLMFLVGAIKPIVEKKSKTCFIFYATVQGRVVGRVRNKTSFVSLHSRFGGGNKNFILKKGESNIIMQQCLVLIKFASIK